MDDVFGVIKSTVEWLILPLVGAVVFFFKKYIQRVELVEKRLAEMEVRMAVVENNIAHIKRDVEDIKKGIEKILDKL